MVDKRNGRGRYLAVILILLCTLAACGQKGDLYLPDGAGGGREQQR